MTKLTSPDSLNIRELTIAYGMTETSPVTFQTLYNDPLEKRIETVGRILPFVNAKVVRVTAEDEQESSVNEVVPVNEEGELLIEGCKLLASYVIYFVYTNPS